MADYTDFDWGQPEEPKSNNFASFDWSDETTPTTAPTAPKISQETVDAATAQPAGAPSGVPEESTGEPTGETESIAPAYAEAQQIASREADKLGLNPYTSGASYGTAIERIGEQAAEATKRKMESGELSLESVEGTKEFVRTEALPAVGGTLGAIMAPATGGSSFLLSMTLTAGAAGAGAALGEGLEQTAKITGHMATGVKEEAPKDGWDILERAAYRGGEEAAWSMVPDMLIRGMGIAKRKILTAGAKPLETVDGEVLDAGKRNMERMMKDYAYKMGLDEEKVLLASDVANVPLFGLAEDVARNSYFGGKGVEAVREQQAEVIKATIKETSKKYMRPAKGYIDEVADAALAKYIEPSMANLNSFAVAGLVNVGFKNAQEAQKSVARGLYKTIDGLMEQTTMKEVYKEVELPLLGSDGRPMTTMQHVMQESPSFPVNLSAVREFAEDRLDNTLLSSDSVLNELIALPSHSSFAQAAEALVDLKARSRALGNAIGDEQAPRRKLLIDQAVSILEPEVDSVLKIAEDSGILTPDGKPLSSLKFEADAIWKEQVEDFQNSYIENILKKADHVNGAPDKLGSLFMQNEMAATKILKILDDAKGTLQGDDLARIEAAEGGIKGSIVDSIFIPFDNIKGQYTPPNTKELLTKASTLKRLFGKDEYEELVKLAGVIDSQSRKGASNYLGFAQRARESGMIMSSLKSVARADFGPLIRDGGSTMLFALGAGRVLTNKRSIQYAAMVANPKIPEATRIQAARALVQRTYEMQQAQEASLTDDQRERMEAELEDRKEADRMRTGM